MKFPVPGWIAGVALIGASFSRVSRAQRSMKQSGMMRCRPGIVPNSAFGTIPDQRCTASLMLALHRIRDTQLNLAARGG